MIISSLQLMGIQPHIDQELPFLVKRFCAKAVESREEVRVLRNHVTGPLALAFIELELGRMLRLEYDMLFMLMVKCRVGIGKHEIELWRCAL